MVTRYHHARELRIIGQQIDKRGIDIFELRYKDGDYVLECGDPNPPFTEIVQLGYSTFQLESLELSAAQARNAGFTRVDFTSMGETLRAIGRYLEKIDAKLLRISSPNSILDGSVFKIEYESRAGHCCAEDMVANDIADLAVRMYKERSRSHRSSPFGSTAT